MTGLPTKYAEPPTGPPQFGRNVPGRETGLLRPHPFPNTMSVRIGNRAGLSNVIQSAQLAGFHGNISRTPALYLGTWEASPLDIASAYSVLPTGRTPHAVHH